MAQTWHVDASRPDDGGDGASWATAKRTIQAAINMSDVLAGHTILVTNGIYAEGGKNVNIGYGFGGTNRAAIDKAITLKSVHGPASTFIVGKWHVPGDTNNITGDAAIRCVYMINGSQLIGFTLTNGATVISGGYSANYGGGIWCESTNAAISNCVLAGNTAHHRGGGAYSGTLFNSMVVGNFAYDGGGGSYASILYNSTIAKNSARAEGGGTHSGALCDCLVTSNTAWHPVYANIGNGGGVFGGAASNCVLSANISQVYGGGAAGSAKLYNSVMLSNTSGSGGGANECALYNCQVISNYAGDPGGVLNSSAYNCLFAGNNGRYGGAAANSELYNCALVGNHARMGGAGVSGGNLYNCTVTGNSADRSDALGVGGVRYAACYNTIVYYNYQQNGVEYNYEDNTALSNSCTTPERVGWAAGNMTNAPMFVDRGSGCGTNLVFGNYRLPKGSPCINMGVNFSHMTDPAVLATNRWLGLDFDGNPRIQLGTVDMGAYEHIPPGTMFIIRGK